MAISLYCKALIGGLVTMLALSLNPTAASGQTLHQGCQFNDIRFGQPTSGAATAKANPATQWFRCGGATGAGSIAVWRPGSSYVTLKPIPWGGVKNVGVVVTAASSVEVLSHIIRSHAVPHPRADTRTARRHRHTKYDVYVIFWGKRIVQNTYKFGITHTGAVRPRSQIGICNVYAFTNFQPGCKWEWVHRDVLGWYRARLEEAAEIANYKRVRGHCPPGQYYSCR